MYKMYNTINLVEIKCKFQGDKYYLIVFVSSENKYASQQIHKQK